MAKPQSASLDEIQYRNPDVLQYWQGVHADSVHGVIKESPFFDHTSKNGLLWDQAWDNGQIFEICRRRETFEARLRSMNGLEFMIVGEPQPSLDPALGPDTGIWVIRKQERRKGPGKEDEITVLGTYYLVGENMYQAPSVYDIVGNHLLSAMTSISKFMDQAADLPMFTPAKGYSYYPPAAAKAATQASQSLSREGSVEANPQASQRSNSIDQGIRASSVIGTGIQNNTVSLDPRDALTLAQSLRLMDAYGDEYMDENPLKGEPGSFVYTHTKDRLRAKQAAAETAAAKAKAKQEAALKWKATTPAAFSTAPVKVKTETPGSDGVKPGTTRKGSKAESKAKRRKSRIATAPTSPNSPAGGTPVAGRSP